MRKCDTYEEVATYLLDQFAADLGLERVEGKQSIAGKESGTTWEIDAKGVRDPDGATIIVECRRRTASRAKQEELAALAYRIIDTEAGGGIYVSPLGLQEGAKRVATARKIESVELSPDSTHTEYMLRFLNKIFAGVQDILTLTDHVTCEVIRGGQDAVTSRGEDGAKRG
jgi:hypothetical protein